MTAPPSRGLNERGGDFPATRYVAAAALTSSSATVATSYHRDGHDVSRRQHVGRHMANCCLLSRLSLPRLRRCVRPAGPFGPWVQAGSRPEFPGSLKGRPQHHSLRACRRHEHTRQLPPHGRADPAPCSFPSAVLRREVPSLSAEHRKPQQGQSGSGPGDPEVGGRAFSTRLWSPARRSRSRAGRHRCAARQSRYLNMARGGVGPCAPKHAPGRDLTRERLTSLRPQRTVVRYAIRCPGSGRRACRYLGGADDHHEQLVRENRRSGGPVMAVGLRHLRSQVPQSRLLPPREERPLPGRRRRQRAPAACELIASRLA